VTCSAKRDGCGWPNSNFPSRNADAIDAGLRQVDILTGEINSAGPVDRDRRQQLARRFAG
jgi:hypothetical protein